MKIIDRFNSWQSRRKALKEMKLDLETLEGETRALEELDAPVRFGFYSFACIRQEDLTPAETTLLEDIFERVTLLDSAEDDGRFDKREKLRYFGVVLSDPSRIRGSYAPFDDPVVPVKEIHFLDGKIMETTSTGRRFFHDPDRAMEKEILKLLFRRGYVFFFKGLGGHIDLSR